MRLHRVFFTDIPRLFFSRVVVMAPFEKLKSPILRDCSSPRHNNLTWIYLISTVFHRKHTFGLLKSYQFLIASSLVSKTINAYDLLVLLLRLVKKYCGKNKKTNCSYTDYYNRCLRVIKTDWIKISVALLKAIFKVSSTCRQSFDFCEIISGWIPVLNISWLRLVDFCFLRFSTVTVPVISSFLPFHTQNRRRQLINRRITAFHFPFTLSTTFVATCKIGTQIS